MRTALNPRARIVAITLALVTVFLVRSPIQLALVWIVLGLPMLWRTGLLSVHLRFLAIVVLPLSATLFLVWGVIMGTQPGDMPHSSPRNGFEFAFLITLRLVVMGMIIQGGLMSLGSDRFVAFCADLGLPRDFRIMLIGASILLPEMRVRAFQVFTARCARGLLKTRSPLNRIRQIPGMLLALVAWALRSAVDRSEMWGHRNLLAIESRGVATQKFRTTDYLLIALPMLWLVSNIIARLPIW
jgi:energy-coupling factor transporter transmembrane protein EcfT